MALNKDLIMLDFYVNSGENSHEISSKNCHVERSETSLLKNAQSRTNRDFSPRKNEAQNDKMGENSRENLDENLQENSRINSREISNKNSHKKSENLHKNSKPEIPIMFCFDERYSAPAAVCFLSLLENADPSFFYSLFVLHSDISQASQDRLSSVVARFKNANLSFFDMQGRFEDLFANFETKAHYSKEVLYKMLCPQIFPDFDKILITDVDVIFAGDISKAWVEFEKSDEICAFTTPPPREVFEILGWAKWLNEIYAEFSQNDREKLLNGGGGGFLI